MADLPRAAATASGGLWGSPNWAERLGRHHGAHVVDGDHGVEGGEVVMGDDHPAAAPGSSRGTSRAGRP